MSGKSVHKIMEEIHSILKNEKELSIRQLSLHIKSQWITVEKALISMKNMELVKERFDDKNKRRTRLFSLR